MKLIIDISEEAKRHIDTFKGKFLCGDGCDMISAIQNGTPLPKGYGRLGDLDALAHKMLWAEIDNLEDKESVAGLMLRFCDKAPTIIEADTEREEQICQ